MQDKEQERSLVNVEKKLNADGFTKDFQVTNGRLCTIDGESNVTYGPEQVTIVDFYRFEGESDPDDMSILYAIEAHDGTRGTISNAFGTYADAGTDAFLRQVEDLGKNLDKAHK